MLWLLYQQICQLAVITTWQGSDKKYGQNLLLLKKYKESQPGIPHLQPEWCNELRYCMLMKQVSLLYNSGISGFGSWTI
jgi:hypothetical protein